MAIENNWTLPFLKQGPTPLLSKLKGPKLSNLSLHVLFPRPPIAFFGVSELFWTSPGLSWSMLSTAGHSTPGAGMQENKNTDGFFITTSNQELASTSNPRGGLTVAHCKKNGISQ